MIRESLQKVVPLAGLPESESLGIRVVISHRRVPIRRAMQVQVNEFLQVCANNLVGVDKNDLLEVHREEDVKEQNLVRPDDTLLLLLRTEPRGPFVRDELVLESIFGGKVRDEFLLTSECKEMRSSRHWNMINSYQEGG